MIAIPRQNDDTIALLTGESVPLGLAMTCYKMIEGMIRHRPAEFAVLMRAYRGELPLTEGPEAHDLREAGILVAGDRLAPLCHAMVDSAVVEPEPGTFEMVNPCRFGSADSQRWAEEEERFRQNLLGGLASPEGDDRSRL